MSDSDEGAPGVDISQALGARRALATQRISLYMPDRDKDNNVVESIGEWIDMAMVLLTKINGGATQMPETRGMWMRPDGAIITENTSIVYSSIYDSEKFLENLHKIRGFIHAFGKATNQGAVMFEISGVSSDGYGIRAYEVQDADYDPD